MADVLGADVVTPREAGRLGLGEYDLVGFGSGIYAMNFYRELRELVETLPHAEGRRAFVFFTSAASDRSLRKPLARLSGTLADRGYEVLGHFWSRGHWNPWWLRPIGGVNKGHPDAADLAAAREHVRAFAGTPQAAEPTRDREPVGAGG